MAVTHLRPYINTHYATSSYYYYSWGGRMRGEKRNGQGLHQTRGGAHISLNDPISVCVCAHL